MESIGEFLLARIAEREAAAMAAMAGKWTWASVDFNSSDAARHGELNSPDRVLRECSAKRRIIDFIFREAESVDGEWGDSHTAEEIRAEMCGDAGDRMATEGLLVLASVYSDHPDYLPEWRA